MDFLKTPWKDIKWNLFETKKGQEIWFKYNPPEDECCPYYTVHYDDWSMIVALEKASKVKKEKHLLTADLVYSYALAIEKGFELNLDKNLKNKWDYPLNKNSIDGIRQYIKLYNK
jgi:hypothetical protein